MPDELSTEKNPSAESAREYTTFLLMPAGDRAGMKRGTAGRSPQRRTALRSKGHTKEHRNCRMVPTAVVLLTDTTRPNGKEMQSIGRKYQKELDLKQNALHASR